MRWRYAGSPSSPPPSTQATLLLPTSTSRAHPATYEAMFLMPTGLPFAAADVPAPMRMAFTALGRALGIADDVRTEIAWSLLHGVASLDRAGRLSASARGRRSAELDRLLGVLTAGVAPAPPPESPAASAVQAGPARYRRRRGSAAP